MERSGVYVAIDSERDYQDSRWNVNTTTSENKHSVEEWILYVEDYLGEAKHILSRETRTTADPKAMIVLRKATAMLVCAMEQHGVKPRD